MAHGAVLLIIRRSWVRAPPAPPDPRLVSLVFEVVVRCCAYVWSGAAIWPWSQTLSGEFGGDLLGRQAGGQEAAQVRPGLLPGRTVGHRSATVSACQVPVPMVAQ